MLNIFLILSHSTVYYNTCINEKPALHFRCQCGHCSVMASEVECVCCKEISRVAGNIDESEEIINCITEHSGFNPVCLNTYVLETAYYQYKQQYRVELENCPE